MLFFSSVSLDEWFVGKVAFSGLKFNPGCVQESRTQHTQSHIQWCEPLASLCLCFCSVRWKQILLMVRTGVWDQMYLAT